jgi:hypothetical protein
MKSEDSMMWLVEANPCGCDTGQFLIGDATTIFSLHYENPGELLGPAWYALEAS